MLEMNGNWYYDKNEGNFVLTDDVLENNRRENLEKLTVIDKIYTYEILTERCHLQIDNVQIDKVLHFC